MKPCCQLLAAAAMATAMAACSPAPVAAPEPPDDTAEAPRPARPSFLTGPSSDAAAPDAAPTDSTGGFADGWVAVAVRDDGTTGQAELLDTKTAKRMQARRPASPGEPEFVRFEKSDAGDYIMLRFGGATARVPYLAQQEGAEEATGVPVWSDPMDGLPPEASVPVYSSPLDGIPPEEIAAAPVFQSALDPAADLSGIPVLQGADDAGSVMSNPMDVNNPGNEKQP